MCCHFVLLLPMLLLSLQWLTVPCSPPLFSPSQSPKRSGPSSGRHEGQKGVLQHNQTPVSLVPLKTWRSLHILTVQSRELTNKATHVRQHWGEACSQSRCSAVRKTEKPSSNPPKPPRASVKTSGFMNVWRAWIRREAGSQAVTLNWKVVSQWSPQWPRHWFSLSVVFPCIQS